MNVHTQILTPIEIIHWSHRPEAELKESPDLIYECNLSRPHSENEEVSTFEVMCILELLHPALGLVFQAETKTIFLLHNKKQKPEVSDLLACVEKAREEFIKVYTEKTKGTRLEAYPVNPTDPEVARQNVSNCIHFIYG